MDDFHYRDGCLHAAEVNLSKLAQEYGTPCYVYSQDTLERHWRAFDDALGAHPHLICYAVKANSNLALLKVLADLGSGFDIVSGGELERVLRAGGDPAKVVFSGIGKNGVEIRRALAAGIHCFNVESEAELLRIEQIAAELGKAAPISLRVNPDVDAETHPYIATGLKENKFGVDMDEALRLYRRAVASQHLEIAGLDCHIGSQLVSVGPFIAAVERVLELAEKLAGEGIALRHLDLGGGLGVRYRAETPPTPAEYATALLRTLKESAPWSGRIPSALKIENSRPEGRTPLLMLEPGRAIAANAGILLTRVEYLKSTAHKNFAIIDAAMNDLLRPALYSAWQDIVPVQPRYDVDAKLWDLVGPVCETGDFLGKGRSLALREGDLLAVRGAGAYGFVMSSNYNTRPRAAEVLVRGGDARLVRRRETLEDLLRLEETGTIE